MLRISGFADSGLGAGLSSRKGRCRDHENLYVGSVCRFMLVSRPCRAFEVEVASLGVAARGKLATP